MKRVIDWDVDGVAVWCDAQDCTNRVRCDACEYAFEAELLEWRLEGDPYLTRDDWEPMERARDALRAAAARLDAARIANRASEDR